MATYLSDCQTAISESNLDKLDQIRSDVTEDLLPKIRTGDVSFANLSSLNDDSVANALLPDDADSNLRCLKAKESHGNGNCLYNSASILLCGK